MKNLLLAILLLTFYFSPKAQKMNNNENLSQRIQAIEDRIALKNLVDTFSVLADVKDVDKQVLLFTENASVVSMRNGQEGNALTGRKQIGDAFAAFLKNFDVVYHINGQQTLTLNGDKAKGVSYCLVTLIGTDNGKRMKTTMGVYYHDDYVKQNGRWLITKRQSNFTWTDRRELGQ
ncbi:MAG: nuclear transport factor 2 family protein [Flavisolibacter sp.]|nr:nuclear transport factor 2 family protein [Flavisolibacter sp.]